MNWPFGAQAAKQSLLTLTLEGARFELNDAAAGWGVVDEAVEGDDRLHPSLAIAVLFGTLGLTLAPATIALLALLGVIS